MRNKQIVAGACLRYQRRTEPLHVVGFAVQQNLQKCKFDLTAKSHTRNVEASNVDQ